MKRDFVTGESHEIMPGMGREDDGDGSNDDPAARKAKRDREAVLARRKFFIASALAGVAATSCDKGPTVCLNIAQTPPEDAAVPMPCLEPPASPEPHATAAPSSDPLLEPSVCLKIAMPRSPDAGAKTQAPAPAPKPRVCLKVAAPKDDD